MAIIPVKIGGGGGADSSEVTATRDQLLSGYTAITSDSNDEPIQGTIQSQEASGNTTLHTGKISQSFSAGYYANAHGAVVTLEEKSVTPSTEEQIITPTSNKVISKVSVAAIPNQTAGGDVKLTGTVTSSTFAAGKYSTSRHYVYVTVYNGSVS